MSTKESLVNYIEGLNLDDAKFSEFQKMIEKKLASKTKKSNVDEFRDDVFGKETKKTNKKENGNTSRHQGPIRINPNNPKKVNCKSWTAYESYKSAKTYDQFKELGGESKHYKYDLEKGLIIELKEEHLKLLEDDPNYDFFKDSIQTKESKAQKKKSSKEIPLDDKSKKNPDNEDLKQKESSSDEQSKETFDKETDSGNLEEEPKETNLTKGKDNDIPESLVDKDSQNVSTKEVEKESIKKTSKKNSSTSDDDISPEELESLVNSLLDDTIDKIVTQENFEKKVSNMSKIKTTLFENPIIKKNFKKNNKDLNDKIKEKYNEKNSFYGQKCKQDFDEINKINHDKSLDADKETNSDEETEEIEVIEHEHEGVIYNLDPKTNIVYDNDTNEQIGKYRDGIIIFD